MMVKCVAHKLFHYSLDFLKLLKLATVSLTASSVCFLRIP